MTKEAWIKVQYLEETLDYLGTNLEAELGWLADSDISVLEVQYIIKPLDEVIDIISSPRRQEIQVLDESTGESLFTLHYSEIENDINLQTASDQDIKSYILQFYNDEIGQLLRGEHNG